MVPGSASALLGRRGTGGDDFEVSLVNVVLKARLGGPAISGKQARGLDLNGLAAALVPFGVYRNLRFSATAFPPHANGTVVLLFRTGELIAVGARDAAHARVAIAETVLKLTAIGHVVWLEADEVSSCVCTGFVFFPIHLRQLEEMLNLPKKPPAGSGGGFPGVTVKYTYVATAGAVPHLIGRKFTFVVFRSGKIIIHKTRGVGEATIVLRQFYANVLLECRDAAGGNRSSAQYIAAENLRDEMRSAALTPRHWSSGGGAGLG